MTPNKSLRLKFQKKKKLTHTKYEKNERENHKNKETHKVDMRGIVLIYGLYTKNKHLI